MFVAAQRSPRGPGNGARQPGEWNCARSFPIPAPRPPDSSGAAGIVELLEQRVLLATFTVTTTLDSGQGSLRQAINNANSDNGLDTILFSIGGGTRTITPNRHPSSGVITNFGALPNISDPVIIDATPPAAFPTQVVQLSGNHAPADANGLRITGGGSTVLNLVINRFGGNGIELAEGGGNVIEGCRIGTNVTGATDLGNGDDGVTVTGSSNNRIGGSSAAQRNVISGNDSDGIDIGAGSTGNQVIGNYIGTAGSGTAPLPNSGNGLRIEAAARNTVGGTAAGHRNVISGNAGHGVRIFGPEATGNVVQGNYIGTDSTGAVALPNGTGASDGSGVLILLASDNTVGGDTAAARNVLSGNALNGVEINGTGGTATGNQVLGNYIGAAAGGTAAVANQNDGVAIHNASGNTVGGTAAGARNVISGNVDDGIEIYDTRGAQAAGNLVYGNYLGLGAGGAALRNGSDGIEIEGGRGNLLGGAQAGARNVISANGSDGIKLWSGPLGETGVPQNNLVRGNLIGTGPDGVGSLGNTENGVNLVGASFNGIGGPEAGAGNVIAFNGASTVGGAGVHVAVGTGNAVRGNSIFSNSAGLPGSGLGIDLGQPGVAPNDAGDGDAGANGLQNYPVLGLARVAAGSVVVQGTLNSAPSRSYHLDFYSSPAADPSGFGEGRTYLGQVVATTDAAGAARFDASLTAAVAAGEVISATATDAGAGAGTSEMSRAVAAAAGPAVVAAAFVYQTSPDSITFSFNSSVLASLGPGDLSVQPVPSGTAFTATAVSYNGATNTATFTLPAALPNGNYRATLSGAGVTDAAARQLAQNYVLDFFVLAGDVNRDRAVNSSDFAILASNFGRTGRTYTQGDLNSDGRVDSADFSILAGNFGRTVPPPMVLSSFTLAAAASQAAAPIAAAPSARPGHRIAPAVSPVASRVPVHAAPAAKLARRPALVARGQVVGSL